MDDVAMKARYELVEALLREVDLDLHRHLSNEGVMYDLFLLDWCMTLFAKRLQLDVLGRVWDQYLIRGEVVVYFTAAAILKAMKGRIMGKTFDAIMKLINAVPIVRVTAILSGNCTDH